MRNFACFIFMLIAAACTGQQSSSSDWVGTTDVNKVSESFSWFREGYTKYTPDSVTTDRLKTSFNGYNLLVFGGTWCGDTRNLLPKFYKSADFSGIPHDRIQLYLLNKSKKSPQKLERKYKIHSIPTFILLKDGQEVGRVVESVEKSIEEDLEKLIRNEK